MVTRIEAMALPGETYRSSDSGSLLRRVAIVVLGATLAGLGFSMLYLLNEILPPEAVSIAAAMAIGLASGFGSRVWLRGSRGALRLATGLAASVLGQTFLGWLTWGFVGVRLQAGALLEPDWSGLIRIGLGSLAAAVSLQAWAAQRPGLPPLEAPATPFAMQAEPAPHASRPRSFFAPGIGQLRSLVARSRRARIHLTGRVEHRCPYCLDPVEPRDPRGEVTCAVCHTRHHADCWGVTGVCQVPHHNI